MSGGNRAYNRACLDLLPRLYVHVKGKTLYCRWKAFKANKNVWSSQKVGKQNLDILEGYSPWFAIKGGTPVNLG